MEMRPVAFGAVLVDAVGEGVAEPPQAATSAVAPASCRNLRRSSAGVMYPLPLVLAPILRS
jgi:hypothetical protein